MGEIKGKSHCIGHNIHVNQIIGSKYHAENGLNKLRDHAFETIDAGLIDSIQEGGILVAGDKFGYGSVREEAPLAIRALGIEAVVASSIARPFFRNAINIGLPVFECDGICSKIKPGDILSINAQEGVVTNTRSGEQFETREVPDFVEQLIERGGITEYMQQLAGQET